MRATAAEPATAMATRVAWHGYIFKPVSGLFPPRREASQDSYDIARRRDDSFGEQENSGIVKYYDNVDDVDLTRLSRGRVARDLRSAAY